MESKTLNDEQATPRPPASTPWNTDPFYEPPGGPDNFADGIVAAINSLVAAGRVLRRRLRESRTKPR